VSEEWFPKPGELIDPEDPTKPKRLRELFKLGKPSEAPPKPLWSSTLPPPPPPLPAPVRPAEYRAARKAFRLARGLRNSRMLISSLRYYDTKLVPQEWTLLQAPRRPKSRKLKGIWKYYLETSRRVCGVVARRVVLTEPPCEFWCRHPLWRQLQLRFGFDHDSTMDWLFDPAIEAQFKALPADFRIATEQITKLDAKIGAVLLEKAREYLLRDIDEETLEIFEFEEAERQARRNATAKSKPNQPAPAKKPTVKEFATAVKAWLRCR
jgi:hypothetical protein